MRLKKTLLLTLIIFVVQISWGQEIELKVIGFDDKETLILSSYKYELLHESLISIKNELTEIQNKLEKNGFLYNQLISINPEGDSLYIAKIHLKNKIENIDIYIDSSFFEKDYFSKLKLPKIKNNYFRIPYSNIESQLTKYNKTVSVSGYPFSTLKLSEIKQENSSTLSAKLIIENQDNLRSLDKVIIKGYEKFPKSFLKRYLKINSSKTFNLESINKKVRGLNNLSFARQIKDPEILFTKDSTQLYLYLEKTISNSFDGFIGFTTNETTNKIDFNGYLNLVLVNNLNYGESLYLDYKSDESDQKNFNLITNLPYLFGSPIGVEASLSILKRDSTFINTKQKASLFYQLNDKNSFYLGMESTESSNLSNNEALINVVDFNSNFYTLRYQYLKRQNEEKLFQIKSILNAEFGIGKRNTTFSKNKQSLVNVKGHHIFNLNNKNSLFLEGFARIINSDNYLENELIRFGGVNSIRGFTENSLTANSLYILNTEYRYKLSNSIFVNSVIDLASFQNNILNQKENLYGFGFGFGILTKGGLLRFIYANGKTENKTFNFSNSKIHLSLNAIF